MAGLADFYTGAMAPPDKAPGGVLVPSTPYGQPNTLAQMYGNVYGETGGNGSEGLTSRTVHTVQIDPYTGNPVLASSPAVQAINAAAPHASGTIDDNKLGYQLASGTLNTPTPFDTRRAAVSPNYGPTGWVDSFFGGNYGPNAFPEDNSVPLNLGSYDPSVIKQIEQKYPAAPKAPAPPPTPVQSLASMYTPAPITYGPVVAAGNFAQGSPNQSFEKQNGMGSVTNSMASSSRWNTGY